MYDTQMMVHSAQELTPAQARNMDDLVPSIDLYVNLIAVFTRLVYILTKNRRDQDDGPSSRRRAAHGRSR